MGNIYKLSLRDWSGEKEFGRKKGWNQMNYAIRGREKKKKKKSEGNWPFYCASVYKNTKSAFIRDMSISMAH